MSSLPTEVEEAARSAARSGYELTDEEVDTLTSDNAFAVAAHLHDEVDAHIGTMRPDLSEANRDAEGNLDTESLCESEVEAFRAVYAAAGALSEARDKLAEAALGREVERLDFAEILERMAAQQGGENQ